MLPSRIRAKSKTPLQLKKAIEFKTRMLNTLRHWPSEAIQNVCKYGLDLQMMQSDKTVLSQ